MTVNPLGKAVHLSHRLRRTSAELSAFFTVGALAFIVDAGGSNALHFGLGLGPLTSKGLSTVASTLVAYVGNRAWTFRHRDRGRPVRRYLLFFALNGVGMGIALACLFISRYVLGLTGPLAYNLSANVIGVGLGTLFRYWSYRRWVFPPKPPKAAPPNGHSLPEKTRHLHEFSITPADSAVRKSPPP